MFLWPWMTLNSQTTSIFAFFVAFHIFGLSKHIIFGVRRLIVASPSRRMTNHPWKGRGYVTWHVLNVGGPKYISGMAEARALKFCTNGDYIKSCMPEVWQITLKSGGVLLTCPIFVCTTVELEKNSPRHSVNCDQQFRRRLIIAPSMVEASAAVH